MPASVPFREPAEGDSGPDLESLLAHVARGEQTAFEAVYDQVAGRVYGLAR